MASTTSLTAVQPTEFRVLVIDDDLDFAEGVADVLAAEGYETLHLSSAGDARTAIFEFPADVAVVDLRLGMSNGIDLIADLAAARPGLSCVVLTGYADVESAVRAIELGVQHYLRKPVKGEELLNTVQQCCARIAGRRERDRAETRRQLLEDQVRRSEKLDSLGVLVGGLAHDFNNLLVGILGHAGLGLMDLPRDHPVRKELLAIEKAALRAAELCKQMLTYSGRTRFARLSIDLAALLDGMAPALREAAGPRIAIELPEPTQRVPAIGGDEAQIRQAVFNVALNAIEAIGDRPGKVHLCAGVKQCDAATLAQTAYRQDLPEGSYVCIGIEDDGCGMDPVTLDRIFDPFFTTKFTGRGLGMPAVLGIVRGHGGFVDIQSSPGAGTRVCLGFPEFGAPGEPLHAPGARGAVLVVEDDDILRAVAKRVYEGEAFRVVTAADGLQAIDRLREHGKQLRLVMLDLLLPGLRGESVYKEIRRLHPELPVLVTSGWSAHDYDKIYCAEDRADFLPKPFTAEELLERSLALIQSAAK